MPRLAHVALTSLLASVALVGCSTTSPDESSTRTSAAPAQPSTAGTASASSAAKPVSAAGAITFTGALSGTMTVIACHEQMAQLVVVVDGRDETYNGLIDADDFTFAVPHSTGYTLADDTTKPTVSGGTFTVKDTRLVSMTDDHDTLTASGSVSCP